MGKGGARLGKPHKGSLLFSTRNLYNFLQFKVQQVIVDTRPEEEYIKAHIKGSLEATLPLNDENPVTLDALRNLLDEKSKKEFEEKRNGHIVIVGLKERRKRVMELCETLVKEGARRVAYFEDMDKFMSKYGFLCGTGKDPGESNKEKFPGEVAPGLYLAKTGECTDEHLRKLHITHVVNMDDQKDEGGKEEVKVNMPTLKIENVKIEDDDGNVHTGSARKVVEDIEGKRKEEKSPPKILLVGGAKNFGPALTALMVLMREKNLSAEEAYEELRKIRDDLPSREKLLKKIKKLMEKEGNFIHKKKEEIEKEAKDEVEKKKGEAEKKAKEEAEKKAKEEAEKKAKEEAEKRAKEEAEKKAKEEAEKRAREEAEKKAREEAERKAREEAEKKAKEEAERLKLEAEEKKKKEEEDKRRREEEARIEAERRAKEEAARKLREEEERKRREEEEKLRKEEEKKKAIEAKERERLFVPEILLKGNKFTFQLHDRECYLKFTLFKIDGNEVMDLNHIEVPHQLDLEGRRDPIENGLCKHAFEFARTKNYLIKTSCVRPKVLANLEGFSDIILPDVVNSGGNTYYQYSRPGGTHGYS
mmetsp:Transcript_28626/g.39897  ORF Transcript_28626/g.39897 Transcript_28626/m.39897 type:complete len:589 (-) Transcript_28626:22-1788(-)